jgi:galactose mutarotase-like enzyme
MKANQNAPAFSNEPFRQLLTSVARNLHLPEWSLEGASLGVEGAASFAVTRRTLHGGKQEGVDLVRISNGVLAITVIPTRGMGILGVESPDLRVGWNSPVKQVVHPQFVNLQSRGGLGWLEGFNEWLVRCGLEFAGAPGRDTFVTNTGAEAEMDLTLHGKIANIPASEVEIVIDREPPFALHLRGRVDEIMFYGPKLELWTELTVQPNSSRFRLEDTVTNRGGAAQEFEMLYHINFGAPLLEAGAQFIGAMKRVTPINASASEAVAEYAVYRGPAAGFVEQVFCMEPLADAEGRTTLMLRNATGTKAVSLHYAVDQLPCFTLWKNTNHLDEGYVTGLEPGTNYPHNRRIERQAGRVPVLQPGQSRSFAIDFSLQTRREEVDSVTARIQRIQGETKPQDDTQPAP